MSVWFEGSQHLNCGIEDVKRAIANHGELYLRVVTRMPGLKNVELVEQGVDSVTIKTNEGLMRRFNISKCTEEQSVTVELDEEYQAGSMVTTTSHFMDEFTQSGEGVRHRTVISDLSASGFLGFFYRHFGSSSTGKAFLSAYRRTLEEALPPTPN